MNTVYFTLLLMKQNFFQNCTLRFIRFFFGGVGWGRRVFCLKITLVIIILDYLLLFVKIKP